MAFVICSSPRTGSHALASALGSHPELTRVAGEVFHRPREYGVSSVRDAFEKFDGFIHHRTPVVKVPGLTNTGIWREILRTPNIRVISLKRRDIFAMTVSMMMAKQSNFWLAKERESLATRGYPDQPPEPKPSKLDIQELEYWLKEFPKEYAYFDAKLRNASVRVCEVWYEDLFENWEEEIARIQAFLGLEVSNLLSPATRKQPDTLAMVTNIEEVKIAVQGTEWAKRFEDRKPSTAPAKPVVLSPQNRDIHSMWIGATLSPMELLTIKSFQANGHTFHLWQYDPIENIPEGVVIHDAAEILPRDRVFVYDKDSVSCGSVVGFSDVWRFAFLYQHGGWWVDMDVCCLRPFDFEDEIVLRRQNWIGNGTANIIKLPAKTRFAKDVLDENAALVTAANIDFILPLSIFSVHVAKHGLQSKFVSPECFINTVIGGMVNQKDRAAIPDEEHRKTAYLTDPFFRMHLIFTTAHAVHWGNQHHTWTNMDRYNPAPGSIYEHLLRKYDVPIGPQPLTLQSA